MQSQTQRLCHVLNGNKCHSLRLRAAGRLGLRGDLEAVPCLIAALSDPHYTVRMQAARSLTRLGDASAVPALQQAARDDRHPMVRSESESAAKKLLDANPPAE